jgi:uncharacterized protein (TIGR02246 family)
MTDADVNAIRAERERSNRALAAHDAAAFGASLASDCVMVRGNGGFVPSRQAYIELIAEDFKNPAAVRYERVPERIDVSTAAPLAAEHGRWTATRPDGKRAFAGTYLAMWRRTDAGWKIRSELFVLLACDDEAACAGYRK